MKAPLLIVLLVQLQSQLLQARQSDSLQQQFYTLTQTLIEKYNLNKIEEVKSDIQVLEKLVPKFETDWNYTNALHKINVIKGRMALKSGDITQAKKYLIEAGNSMLQLRSLESMTFGSPQLGTFGPNMSLAKELLEAGERDVILEYFKICSKVWTGKIKEWEDTVKKGEIPDFGGNLFY